MTILYPIQREDIGPMMIYMIHTGENLELYTLVPMLSDTISLSHSFESKENLIDMFSREYGEVEIRDFESPIDALMDAGHWLHVRDIREYHDQVNRFLDNDRIPSLNSTDRDMIQDELEHDHFMVRMYDQAILDAELSGYPLWIADQYYGHNLKSK